MVRWEYKVLHVDAHPNDIFSAMSRAGRDGWELSCVVGKYVYLKLHPLGQGGRGVSYLYCPNCGVSGRLSRETDEDGELIGFECDNCHGLYEDPEEDEQ